MIDTESQAPNDVHKIRFDTPPPVSAANILFDAVNNLRASLDQIGHCAAIASGKIKPRGTNFPFADTAEEVEETPQGEPRTPAPAAGDPGPFRSVEPHRGGNGQLSWAINKLCNTKKHSNLVPTMVTGACSAALPARSGLVGSNWMPNELELILMVVPPQEDPPGLSGSLSFTVSVDSVDLIRDKPIVMVLEGAAGSVADLLVSAEAICQRANWGFLARPER